MARFDLTDFEWSVIQPLLPNKSRGVARVDDRRVSALDKRRFANALELKLLRCRGDRLQEFLAALMEKTQASNFNGATANFSQGDLKCDGMLTNP